MKEAIRLVRLAFEELAAGNAQNQPRRRLFLPTGAILHSMAGAWGGYFGTKIYATHPRHRAHFLFLLYRAEDAAPVAMMEANCLGQIRTGAATGMATNLLARPEGGAVGIIGSGFQARSQLEAVLHVRRIDAVRVWSRKAENREDFARACSESFQVPVEAVDSAERAVEGASIVVTATNSKEPVLQDGWVAPGAHINAIGSNQPQRKELPPELVRRAALIAVDSIEQARLESGDLLLALGDEDWRDARIVELKDLTGRQSRSGLAPGDVSIFKSNGLGLEDVAVAAYVYEQARKLGQGQELRLFYS